MMATARKVEQVSVNEDPAAVPSRQVPTGTEHARKKLTGLRVLDVTSVMAGPFSTALLGDLGAEIIKVEQPTGDVTRRIGPARSADMGWNFLTLNRNKRSVVLDLRSDAGKRALLDLARTCSVFVCNLRPDAVEKLGITYRDISAVNPAIIYCRVSGWGRGHAEQDSPAYDDIIQAATGMVDLQARYTGAPRYIPMSIVDFVTALMATISILAALSRTAPADRGEEIEVSMFDTMASLVMTNHIVGSTFVPPLGPPVYERAVSLSRKPFRTRDGSVSVLPYSDENWKRFFTEIGRADLAASPDYADVASRTENIVALYESVESALAEQDTDHWVGAFKRAGIPCEKVASTADLLQCEPLYEAGILHRVQHPTEGAVTVVGSPIRYGGATSPAPAPAPGLGQHTRAVLAEIGYTDEQIGRLTP